MASELKTEKRNSVPFNPTEDTGRTVLNKFDSQIRADSPKIEQKITRKENIISAIKGGAVGLALMASWFDMSVPTGPLLVTASFSAITVAMNYNQITKDFKEGFQKGVIVGTPLWVLATNAAPGFVSISLMTIGTIWGLCTSIKKKKEKKEQVNKEYPKN